MDDDQLEQGSSPAPKVNLDEERRQREPWRKGLNYTETGLRNKCPHNGLVFLNNHPDLRGSLRFNTLKLRVQVLKPLPWDPPGTEVPRYLNDNDCFLFCVWLARQGQHGFTVNLAAHAIEAAARARSFNPLQDYLNSLEWDGHERVYRWLADYLGAMHNEYTEVVGRKTLVSAVARALNPGNKCDTMLILEGEQGKMKSTAIEKLFGSDYFTDEISAIGSKDAAMQLQGNWCVEMAELTQLDRAEEKQIKEWLSRHTDKFRPPYGREIIESPRSCIAIGTVNPLGGEYLKDPTGGRRFWPVYVMGCDLQAIERDRDQLWAEAVYLYREGTNWWISEHEAHLVTPEQEARRQQDVWEATILSWLGRQTAAEFTTAEILTGAVQVEVGHQTQAHSRRLSGLLQPNGWEHVLVRRAGDRVRVWRRRDLGMVTEQPSE